MAYVLEENESLNEGFRRIITEKIESALENLREGDEEQRDQAILDARTSFKRIRAALRLVRGSISKTLYQEQNIFYRDIARLLSPVRDAHMVIETLDKALEKIGDSSLKPCGDEIRNRLIADYEAIRDDFWEQNIVGGIIEDLEYALLNMDKFKLKKSGFKAIERGLYKSYQWGYLLMEESYDNIPEVEPFHEWRKWVKYLRYQMQIIRNANIEVLDPYIKDVKLLADCLGDAHDFDVLKAHIEEFEQVQSGTGRQIIAQLDYLRGQIELEAKPLAKSIYKEKPKKFVKRIYSYWDS